jgi:hypothetical protein
MLLGRPTEQWATQRTDDEQVSRGAGDDVSLRPERRHSPVLRMANPGLDDEDEWGVNGLHSYDDDVLAVAVQDLAFGSVERESPYTERPAFTSRGPPSIHS